MRTQDVSDDVAMLSRLSTRVSPEAAHVDDQSAVVRLWDSCGKTRSQVNRGDWAMTLGYSTRGRSVRLEWYPPM